MPWRFRETKRLGIKSPRQVELPFSNFLHHGPSCNSSGSAPQHCSHIATRFKPGGKSQVLHTGYYWQDAGHTWINVIFHRLCHHGGHQAEIGKFMVLSLPFARYKPPFLLSLFPYNLSSFRSRRKSTITFRKAKGESMTHTLPDE